MTIRKALITGGTGFVGSNLARRLALDGWQVHIITIPNDNLAQIKDVAERVTLHVHDGSTEGLHKIVAEAQPEVVFHLASLFLSEHLLSDITTLVSSNILFGTQLLEAMADQGVTKIVNTGTSWQHFENKGYSPVNLYAATKQAFEDILQYYVEARDIQAITLKLFDTYGPNDPRPKLLHLLKKIAGEGASLSMSPGEQVIDLVHINDVVKAFVMGAKRLNTDLVEGHEKYAVTSGNPMSLRMVVKAFEKSIGRNINIEWSGRPYRTREVMVPWSDFKTLPGWKSDVKLEEGLEKL